MARWACRRSETVSAVRKQYGRRTCDVLRWKVMGWRPSIPLRVHNGRCHATYLEPDNEAHAQSPHLATALGHGACRHASTGRYGPCRRSATAGRARRRSAALGRSRPRKRPAPCCRRGPGTPGDPGVETQNPGCRSPWQKRCRSGSAASRACPRAAGEVAGGCGQGPGNSAKAEHWPRRSRCATSDRALDTRVDEHERRAARSPVARSGAQARALRPFGRWHRVQTSKYK